MRCWLGLALVGTAACMRAGQPPIGAPRAASRARSASVAASSARASAPAGVAAGSEGGGAESDVVADWSPGDIAAKSAVAPGLTALDPAGWFSGLLAAAPAPAPAGGVGDALRALRAAGAAELSALVEGNGLPVSKSEAWRHIGVRDLYKRELAQPAGAPAPPVAALPDEYVADGALAVGVFVDGAYAPELSRTAGLPAGAYLGGLAGLDADRRAELLGRLVVRIGGDNGNTLGLSDAAVAGALGGAPFCALNAAAALDVAALLLPAGAALPDAAPVHLVFVSTGAAAASHPRYLIDAGPGSAVTLVTSHVDAAHLAPGSAGAAGAGSAALSNAVGQLLLADGALVRHTLVAERGPQSSHVENVEANCMPGARYDFCTLQGPAAMCRINVGASLLGEGAQAHARGLMLSGGDLPSGLDLHTVRTPAGPRVAAERGAHHGCTRPCHAPTLTLAASRALPLPRVQAIRHLSAGCSSSQLQKALLAQKGRAVFRGLIRANGLAERTVAHQLCRSMLLSEGAKLDVSPCLEIVADDVECTHGATVADLDEEKASAGRAERSTHSRAPLAPRTIRPPGLCSRSAHPARARAHRFIKNRIKKTLLRRARAFRSSTSRRGASRPRPRASRSSRASRSR